MARRCSKKEVLDRAGIREASIDDGYGSAAG